MTTVTNKLNDFFSAYTLRAAKSGEILIQAGDEPAGVFFLTTGRVRKYDISDHGSEMVVNTYKEGAFFPMAWVINGEPNEYFYETATKCTYHVAPADDVVAFLKDNPDVLFDLLARVFRGVEGLTKRMAFMVGSNAHRRALFELYISCRRFGTADAGSACSINIHEGELAQAAGLSRETFSRELQSLKKSGRVLISRKGLTVTDMKWLERELEIS
ncbi:MAG TPA: Crp/Fnr family transcriptional regulator [Candidatus Saccharimonadales bacterium]|nr:Crp/Fnr family transcriptional regulator [Candidatus Saccharimonadales bacterium]